MSQASLRKANLKFKGKQRQGRQRRPSIASLRVSELSRLFSARYGEVLPDDDAGRDDAVLMVHHLGQLTGDPRPRIMGFIELRCPWMPIAEAKALLLEVIDKPRRWRADKLAWRLRLTHADRATLKITTIGSVDKPKSSRWRERQDRARLAKERKRRASGARPRAEYLAAVTQPKPWKALGISRATWYRRRADETAAPP
jgi:hypothetical protein